MSSGQEASVYGMIGDEGFDRLTTAFYRQVPADDLLGPMYPADDLTAARERLRDFLIYRFGGPQHYIEQRGHPRLRGRHAPFAVTPAARDRWLQLMRAAIAEADLPREAVAIMDPFFEHSADFLVNQPG